MDRPRARERPTPLTRIRRFDIFAEYQRLTYERKGMPPDQARGFALWLAKVIAARKFARRAESRAKLTERLREGRGRLEAGAQFLELGGERQTDELFGREIVQRMGETFYRQVFSPAIAEALEQRRSYEAIRDPIRAPWNRAYERRRVRAAA